MMPAQSSNVIPTLPGTLSVSILSPRFNKFPASNLFMKQASWQKKILTCQFCCPADVHSWPELLDKDELLSVGVEDDDGDAAVTPHQVPDLGPPSLAVLQPHGIEETGLGEGN